MAMYKIFIVEDDEMIAAGLKRHLESWDYKVVCAQDLANIMPEFVYAAPQLVLMDIKLPFYNGYYWCTEIRKVSKVPIIFLSSAADNMNIVMAVNMGGLTVKIQAMLRRSYDFVSQSVVLEHQGAMLNLTEATLTYGTEKLELTKNELRILQILMENKEKVVARDTLMAKLWESDSYIDENTWSVNVNRLRKKLECAGLVDFIQTKKGIGYRVG